MNNPVFSSFLYPDDAVNNANFRDIARQCRSVNVKKNDFLLRQGEVCRQVLYVEKGLLRQYSVDEKGKEHVLMFAPENWFAGDRGSIFFSEASSYFIQALEDSRIMLIEESLILKMAKENPAFLEFNNRLLHNHIRSLQKRITLLLSSTAEQRYLDFINIYPDILVRVPQAMVASYLGITPESLSRVRKELAVKNFRR